MLFFFWYSVKEATLKSDSMCAGLFAAVYVLPYAAKICESWFYSF